MQNNIGIDVFIDLTLRISKKLYKFVTYMISCRYRDDRTKRVLLWLQKNNFKYLKNSLIHICNIPMSFLDFIILSFQ